ncbi:MAG: FHA domain-containing protein [Rhodobacteraceae bacterium]|nr:FHA domain-containing protein [Paracoccaceae bacterium]
MGLLGKLFRRSSKNAETLGTNGVDAFDRLGGSTGVAHEFRRSGGAAPSQPNPAQPLAAVHEPLAEQPAEDGVNIWDLEDFDPTNPAATQQATADLLDRADAAPARKRRNRTRLLGFEHSDGQVVDLFENPVEAKVQTSARFPVGWVIVLDGPGRGESFTLHTGMSSIGRGEDQAVQLDFGDNAISRSSHAAIVFDPEESKFVLGQGGKSNIVRLNGKPVISNEPLTTMDKINIGETTLQFIALCNENFTWTENKDDEAENVEIA